MLRAIISALLLCAVFFQLSLALAEQPSSDLHQSAQDISDTTMSPFCPGRTISACPSDEARQLRGKIESWLQEGYSEAAVRNQLSLIYGEEVSGAPRFSGVGWLGWLLPGFVALAGGVFIVIRVRREKTSPEPEVAAAGVSVDEVTREQVERDVKSEE